MWSAFSFQDMNDIYYLTSLSRILPTLYLVWLAHATSLTKAGRKLVFSQHSITIHEFLSKNVMSINVFGCMHEQKDHAMLLRTV